MTNRRVVKLNDRSYSYDSYEITESRYTNVRNIKKKKKKEYVVNIMFNYYIVEKVYAIKLWNCCEPGIGRELFLLRKLQFFFFLLKLIIHVGGEWKGGWLNYWQVCWKGQGLERIDGQSGTYVSHCSML